MSNKKKGILSFIGSEQQSFTLENEGLKRDCNFPKFYSFGLFDICYWFFVLTNQ
jgi:hypothetical protein